MGSRRVLVALSTGVLIGAMLVGSLLFAQSKPQTASVGGFDIVDTPGSTYLLNRESGQVWRLGFTEVKGDRYWFGTFVPLQPPTGFQEFQENLRRRAGGQAP
jgi:hypothetical protein